MQLNKDQEKALHFLKAWWFGNQTFSILEGKGGVGKAQPLTEKVITPSGVKLVKDINEGDFLMSKEGTPTKVLKVFNHVNLNMYKITFSDNTTTECCEDHLWEVQTLKMRHLGTSTVLPLKSMLYRINSPRTGKQGYYYSIPLTSPVEFKEEKYDLSPYKLGYILGNGCSRIQDNGSETLIISYHNQDKSILDNFEKSDIIKSGLHQGNCDRANLSKDIRDKYANLGLVAVKSSYKFVPKRYLLGTSKQRKELLAGLMDSDGSCFKNRARFSTSSNQLALDIVELVQSLGGKGTIYTTYRDIDSFAEYNVQIRVPFNPFFLERKAKNYKVISWDYHKAIVKAEYIGKRDGKCFLVDNERHLYLTNQYTVTHNTFLIKHFLKQINVPTLLLAPTHQARKQLEYSLGKDKKAYEHEFRTADSALGIYPTTTKETIDFEHVKLPDVWNEYQLAIIDEASMLPDWKIQLLTDIGIKILFVGHRSQLPPIIKNKANDDSCISPVFTLNIPIVSLHIPQRNLGAGWDFCNLLEDIIYTNIRNQSSLVPDTFDIGMRDLFKYLSSEDGLNDIVDDKLKVIAWTNSCVDNFNKRIRLNLYGDWSQTAPYIKGDKLILTEPLTLINDLKSYNTNSLIKLQNQELIKVYSNSALEVIKSEIVQIKLEKDLVVSAYQILVNGEYGQHNIYVLLYDNDLEKINFYYDRKAWTLKDNPSRKRAYRNKFFILSCFAKVKYFYAATAYRMQGSTIDKVIVVEKDIASNPCLAEQAKTRYVAVSRHKSELMFYRGMF